MKKQEAIEKIENAIPDFILNDFQRGKETGLTYALELVEELDEPEKVVVSKLEAEWLDKLKAYYRHREDRLYVITRQGWGNDFCFSCHGEQIELSYEPYKGKEDIESVKRRLVNAILYGYEVEKEKLYTVEIPNPNSDNHLVLRKNFDGKVCVSLLHSEYWRGNESTRLTEAEIKECFNWAWQFAKEVEND
ncbi:MAG: DUF1642 domain-containing protein [Streptococcus sp.]|nr:DUF1642 domain-containing protein [Streptococcus sp.]